MTATDAQVRVLMRERMRGKTQEQAAAKANLGSRKTVARYEKLGQAPSELKRPRTYRTHADVFEQDWPEIEEMLRDAPELEGKALFEWLCEEKCIGQVDAGTEKRPFCADSGREPHRMESFWIQPSC